MARPQRSSFRWPGRDRSNEIERAADRAAERGLERLRERQRRRRAPAPPPEPWSGALEPDTPAPPWPGAREPDTAPPADNLEAESDAEVELVAPDLWEAEFDALAEDLVDKLRRDLGPAPDRPVE